LNCLENEKRSISGARFLDNNTIISSDSGSDESKHNDLTF